MIELIDLAPAATYEGGIRNGAFDIDDVRPLNWDDTEPAQNGFARILRNALCEDNQRYDVLQMHPAWDREGTIVGRFPAQRIPATGVFRARVGFLSGAEASDGVTFQVWESHVVEGQEIRNRLLLLSKGYNLNLPFLEADLSHLAGENVSIELQVDAGPSSGRDWAIWVDPRIETRYPLTIGVPMVMDLTSLAAGGRFEGGRLLNTTTVVDNVPLRWDGEIIPDGYIQPMENKVCEDGRAYDILHMHPKWVANGTIVAWMPWTRLGPSPVFKSGIGFIQGAGGTDGVTFQVFVHLYIRGQLRRRHVFTQHKPHNGRIDDIEFSLRDYENTEVRIELRVDAGASSGRDWAAWINPRIESPTIMEPEGQAGQLYQFRATDFGVLDSNERRGDEPYFGAIYFRSIFGKPGSTRIQVMDRLQTLGGNMRTGRMAAVPAEAELQTADVGITWESEQDAFLFGVPIMGLVFVAMEEDRRGKGTVRSRLRENADRLADALRNNVESNPLGILDPGAVFERVVDEVEGEGGGQSTWEILRDWLFRADDQIGQAGFVMVGATNELLGDLLGSEARGFQLFSLGTEAIRLEFEGSSAHYFLNVVVENSPTETLVR